MSCNERCNQLGGCNRCRCGGINHPVIVNNNSGCNPCRQTGPYKCSVSVVDSRRRPVCGARVTLVEPCTGVRLSAVTNCSGTIVFCNLPAGNYLCTLVGINSSEDCKNTTIKICINQCNPCPCVCLTTASIQCSGRINVRLVSANPGKPIEGGKFELRDENDEVVSIQTTNEKGIASFTNLQKGLYTIKQIKAPHPYMKSKREYEVELDRNNRCENILVKNKKCCKGAIAICLKKCRGKKPICGAKFAIYACGKKIDEKCTNECGCLVFKHLKAPKKYVIKQLTSKPGYSKINKPMCVKLTCENKCKKLELCNRKKPCKNDKD
jgi:hypothetical protein